MMKYLFANARVVDLLVVDTTVIDLVGIALFVSDLLVIELCVLDLRMVELRIVVRKYCLRRHAHSHRGQRRDDGASKVTDDVRGDGRTGQRALYFFALASLHCAGDCFLGGSRFRSLVVRVPMA